MNTAATLSIDEITEEDFWSHLAVPAGTADPRLLMEAIEHGRAGRRERAYATLAEHHRTRRADAWSLALEEANRAPRIKPAALAKALKTKLALGESRPGDYYLHYRRLVGDTRLEPSVRTLHELIHRFAPVALHAVRSRSGTLAARRRLADVLAACYEHRRPLAVHGAYPLNTMLGAHAQFHFFWWSYLALVHGGTIEPAAAEVALKLIMGIGRAMRQQTDRYMVHNIFTAGCYGLFFLARHVKEFRDAPEWERHALAHLNTDWDRSFFADGGHLERNWGYGFHTLGRMTNTYRFAQKTGGLGEHERHFTDGLRRAYRFYATTLGPDETCPGFGDEGLTPGGHVLDTALTTDLFPVGTPRDLGVDRSKSYFLAPSGIAIMRNGGEKTSAFASVTFGDFAGWHSHMDSLSMNLWSLGEKLIEETPRFGPYEHGMDVLWRNPEAHNQLLVDGFHYDNRPIVGEDAHWHSDAAADYFSARHAAYRQVAPHGGWRTHHASGDLVVRRTIVFVKDPGYALVLDAVWDEKTGRFNRATTGWWHSPRKFEVLRNGLARTAGRRACLLAWARPEALRRLEVGDDYRPEEAAGQPHASPTGWHHLRARTWMELPHSGCLGLATVLFPFEGRVPKVTIRPLPLAGGVTHRAEAFEVTTPAGKDVIVLNPERMDGVQWRSKPVASRAVIHLGRRRGTVVVD